MEAHASSLLFMLTYNTLPSSSSERACITPIVLPQPLGPSTITYPTVVSSALRMASVRYGRGTIGALASAFLVRPRRLGGVVLDGAGALLPPCQNSEPIRSGTGGASDRRRQPLEGGHSGPARHEARAHGGGRGRGDREARLIMREHHLRHRRPRRWDTADLARQVPGGRADEATRHRGHRENGRAPHFGGARFLFLADGSKRGLMTGVFETRNHDTPLVSRITPLKAGDEEAKAQVPPRAAADAHGRVLLGEAHLCGKQGGSDLGQLPLPVPDRASGCPELRPASANQPLGPRWPAVSALFFT
eukprot:scaffold93599_cov63-Phaeocystis_antarctica.AAC.2